MIVTYIHSNYRVDQPGVQLRCRNMADAINRAGIHRANLLDLNSFIQNTEHAQKVCDASDLIVIHRHLYGRILATIQYWKARDKKIIFDFDEAVNYLTEDMPSYAFWFEGVSLAGYSLENASMIEPPPIEQFKWGLAMVDAATVPSDRLADDWSRYTNIHKVLDYINTSQYPALHQSHGDEIWIGFGDYRGYGSPEKSGLLAAMENVCHKLPKVKFVFLENDIKPGSSSACPVQLETQFQYCSEDWANILPGLNIGLVPIYGNYDLRLGYYDLLEFMISKIPWIASGKPSYDRISQYGQWIENTPYAWENAILNTIDQLEVYQREAEEEPFLFALSQGVDANIEKILKIYGSIINPSSFR